MGMIYDSDDRPLLSGDKHG